VADPFCREKYNRERKREQYLNVSGLKRAGFGLSNRYFACYDERENRRMTAGENREAGKASLFPGNWPAANSS